MRAGPGVAALGAMALGAMAIVALPPAAAAPGKLADPAEAEPPASAERFDALLPRLETALTAARADTAFDAVALIEAEETANVAEELLEEGEAEIAVTLLEQAIALLSAPPPE
jgi:hypothetical protein